MRANSPRRVAIGVLFLAVGAALSVAVSAHRGGGTGPGRDFQRLVGGLGFGPALDLSRCDFTFDPRVGNVCPGNLGPIPSGRVFCPEHACSIFPF